MKNLCPSPLGGPWIKSVTAKMSTRKPSIPVNFAIHGILTGEEVFDLLDEDVAAHVADGFGEGELFGAGLDAVLREAALLNAAISS